MLSQISESIETSHLSKQLNKVLELTSGYAFGMSAFEPTTETRVANVHVKRQSYILQLSR